jgi:hypothetical protein
MRTLVSATLMLLMAGPALAAENCAAPSFAFTPERTAKHKTANTHGFYVVIKGDGWYVGDQIFTTSGVPIVGTTQAYLCPMLAGAKDKGTRSAEVMDEYGNILMTLSGKSIDKDMKRLLIQSANFIPELRHQAGTAVTKARALAKAQPKQAATLLESVAKLKGWKEGDEARALLRKISG